MKTAQALGACSRNLVGIQCSTELSGRLHWAVLGTLQIPSPSAFRQFWFSQEELFRFCPLLDIPWFLDSHFKLAPTQNRLSFGVLLKFHTCTASEEIMLETRCL